MLIVLKYNLNISNTCLVNVIFFNKSSSSIPRWQSELLSRPSLSLTEFSGLPVNRFCMDTRYMLGGSVIQEI
jgi:hypothetical protein